MNRLSGFLVFIIVLMSISIGYADVMYQDDFDGTVIGIPYIVWDGDLAIADPVLNNTTKSLAFNCLGNPGHFYYDQIGYFISKSSRIELSFDIVTDGLQGTPNNIFSIFFDTPRVRKLIFKKDGTIIVNNLGVDPIGFSYDFEVGAYTDQVSVNVKMSFDIDNDQWQVFLDNTLVYDDKIDGTLLETIRFSFGSYQPDIIDFDATVYIDNLKIEEIPETNSIAPVINILLED
jgi:hypothetical protein